MEDLYRFSQINRETPLYGIIGHPVMHTRSPEIHNRGYTAAGMPGVYIPFETDDLPSFLAWAWDAGFRGFSVTVPHKEAIISLLREKDPSVDAIGACNTIYRIPSGGWGGVNTDASGFLLPLLKRFPLGISGRETAVIGAGGAARAVVFALQKEGARVTIYNRTVERAEKLALTWGCRYALLEELGGQSRPEILIQTTSAGMEQHGVAAEDDPIPRYRFQGDETVFEIVYAPPRTPLLIRAEEAGCQIIGGMEMLRAQGWEQFKIFTGTEYPEET
jgi:3-dehydroquinate dehydratase/shikimate dehydrogenase